jgi:hypothetical protein
MRVPNLQVDKLLAGELGRNGSRGVFDGRTETDTDEAQDCAVAFANAKDVVLEVGACCSCALVSSSSIGLHRCLRTPHSLLFLIRSIFCQAERVALLIDVDVRWDLH